MSGFSGATSAGAPINNLTSTSTTQPLSAAQGKALNEKFGGYKIISGTATGTTDSNGLFAPSPSIPSTTKIIMVYGAGSRTIIPIVAASDSTWRFIVCNTSLQPQASVAVTVAYVALVSA